MLSFKQFLIEELHVLMEVPSIEDQIDTGVYAIGDVKAGEKKLYIRAPNSKISIQPEFSFQPLKSGTSGQFRSYQTPILKMLKDMRNDLSEIPGNINVSDGEEVVVDSSLKDAETQKISDFGSEVVGHEVGGHAHQYAAQARDIAAGKKVDPAGYAEKREERKSKLQTKYSQRKATPTDLQNAEFAEYRFEPQEVNARSAEGAIAVDQQIKKVTNDKTAAHNAALKRSPHFTNAMFDYGMKRAQADSDVELPKTATRHERSQLKRQKIMATKDARAAVSRGIQKAMGGIDFMTTPEWVADKKSKERNAEIQRKVQAMRDRASGTKPAPSPEMNIGKVASTVLDPVSAAADAVTIQASKSAPKFATKSLPGSKIAGINMAAGLGAGVVGGLAGEFAIKPAAEKLGAFKSVEAGGALHRTLSKTPSWVPKAADAALGAAQVALDPISAASDVMSKGMEAKAKREVDTSLKAGSPSKVRVTGPKI